MSLKRFDFKEITSGTVVQQVSPATNRSFVPNRSRKAEAPPPPPTFNQDDMQAAEREGFKKGFAAGEKEGHGKAQSEQAEVNRKLVAMQEKFVASVAPIFEHYRQMVLQMQKDIPAVALSIARKIAAEALDKNAAEVITELSMRSCETMINEPELTIIAHESMTDTLEQKLQQLAERLPAATKIVIVRDPDMPLSDCRIEWQNGSLERVTAQLWQQVEKALGNMTVVAVRDATAQMEDLQKQISTVNEKPSSEKE